MNLKNADFTPTKRMIKLKKVIILSKVSKRHGDFAQNQMYPI